MDGQEVLWNAYSNTNEWIRFSDTKAALVLGIYGAVGAFALPGLIDHIELIKKYDVLIWALGIGILFSIVSIFFSIRCLVPSLTSGETKLNGRSLLYFKDISDTYAKSSEYNDAITKLLVDQSEIQKQITQQIWINSKIAELKFRVVRWSVLSLVGSIILGIIFVILSLTLSSGI